MRMFLTACVALCVAMIAGCGGEEEETGAAAGEVCADASECQSGLLCFVEVDGEDGKCTEIPAACGEDARCSSDCLDDLRAKCPNSSSSCVSFGSSINLACNAAQ